MSTAVDDKPRIYVSSTIRHTQMWRYYRQLGHHIISSWIDLEGTLDVADIGRVYWPLWLSEAASSDFLIFYSAYGDRHHEHCLLEIGSCLTTGGTVLHVGVSETMKSGNGDLADFTHHPNWHRLTDLDRALAIAAGRETVLPEAVVPENP